MPDEFRPLRIAILDNDPLVLKLLVQLVPRWVAGTEVAWFTQSGLSTCPYRLIPSG